MDRSSRNRIAILTASLAMAAIPPLYMLFTLAFTDPGSRAEAVVLPPPIVAEQKVIAQEPPPPPIGLLGLALSALWKGGEIPAGLSMTKDRKKMENALRKVCRSAPRSVEVLHAPEEGNSGLFTLKVIDEDGREGVLGVRLLHRDGDASSWELRNVIVLVAPH
jgi:hypothetical protein